MNTGSLLCHSMVISETMAIDYGLWLWAMALGYGFGLWA